MTPRRGSGSGAPDLNAPLPDVSVPYSGWASSFEGSTTPQ